MTHIESGQVEKWANGRMGSGVAQMDGYG